jgi:AraC-like DNA-binding protein
MNYQETPPSGPLAKFIKCFWALEYRGTGASVSPEPVLPDGCPEIVFNLSDRFVRVFPLHQDIQPQTIFAGQMSRSIVIMPRGNVNLFGVRFHPAGAGPLLGFPVSEVTDRILDFADACGVTGKPVENKISEAGSFGERKAIFEAFYLSKLSERGVQDSIAAFAADMILAGRGAHAISGIAKKIGVSDRRLERRFKQFIGISPKTFSRIIRFQTVVSAVQQSGSRNLLDTALSFGYYDQSHLIRDFNEFSGVSPLAYFERTHQISDAFTGAQ